MKKVIIIRSDVKTWVLTKENEKKVKTDMLRVLRPDTVISVDGECMRVDDLWNV